MGHIFISYSKKDIVYAEKLIKVLRREGFSRVHGVHRYVQVGCQQCHGEETDRPAEAET